MRRGDSPPLTTINLNNSTIHKPIFNHHHLTYLKLIKQSPINPN